MLGRAGVIWFGIMIGAIGNGAFRDGVLVPRVGDPVARAVSCVTLAAIIVAVARISLEWIHPTSTRQAWTIGAMWLVLTLAFEFGAGHYLFHTPWAALVADYNVLAGRLWILVLIATFTAPVIVYRVGHYRVPTTEISAATQGDTPRR